MTKEQYKKIEKYMLENVDENAHDSYHIYRVLNNALIIANKYKNINYEILITSCLLHDIARNKQRIDSTICHAQEGGNMAYQFLIKNNYSNEFALAVKECITTHRFRSNNEPKTIEAKILFDADKLDVIGPLGIARTLLYNGALNNPLYLMDENDKIDYGLNLASKDSFLKEYNYKLKKLYNKFYTSKAKQLSKKYKKTTSLFYNDLIKQINIDDLNNQLIAKKFK